MLNVLRYLVVAAVNPLFIYFISLLPGDSKGLAFFAVTFCHSLICAVVAILLLYKELPSQHLFYGFILGGNALTIFYLIEALPHLLSKHGEGNIFHYILFMATLVFLAQLIKLITFLRTKIKRTL